MSGLDEPLHINGLNNGERGEDNSILMQELQSEVEVVLSRGSESHLGFTVEIVAGELQVGHVLVATPSRGQLLRGDRLLSVNGETLAGSDMEQLAGVLAGKTELHFRVRRGQAAGNASQSLVRHFLRAPYSYNSIEDKLHPCQIIGLAFNRGDVIMVVDAQHPDWWQGCTVEKDSEEPTSPIRLFPSPEFQKRNQTKSNHRLDYEPQMLVEPQLVPSRPIVLLGPPCGGRHELLAFVIEQHPDRFATPAIHTTRQPEDGEAGGVAYLFISESEFKALKSAGRFLETWKSEGSCYGIQADSIRDVASNGRVCVLALRPDGLERLRQHRPPLKPFAVFVRPPAEVLQLRKLHENLQEFLGEASPQLSDNELASIARHSNRMDFEIGHRFDLTLELVDLQSCVQQLVNCVDRSSSRPQWLPTEWTT